MVLRALHLCSGYGGFELGLRLAGVDVRTVAHVERDAYAAATLVARMEESRLDQSPIWSDLCTFDGAAWRGRVDIVTAGFPCQPFSAAGRRRGIDDDRWLWPEIARIIGDVRPRYVFLENVPQLVRHGLPHVLADLARLGFDAEWGLLSAAAVGAPHKRERFWLVAHATRAGWNQRNDSTQSRGLSTDAEAVRGDLAHTTSVGLRRGLPGGQETPHTTPTIGGSDMADTAGEHGREPHHQGRTKPRRDPWAHTGRLGFPPPPNDTDGWANWIAAGGPEPSLRRRTDGPPLGLADALHLGGNGLVPQVAAAAWHQLAARLETPATTAPPRRNP